jgi:hypothetical protein
MARSLVLDFSMAVLSTVKKATLFSPQFLPM